ncbi:MAG: 4-hydroxy-tetrahydrodipicolinate synthase [Lachnospiraceae bacterium]|nr:4-hydroxy-tetrahydrodipicolinate synthase [Lachnospiraceae bacterium]MDD7665381.1 4-hydroxy-tetrahydrodipicolinate synthase [Lachnospiraceae bacterium]MDY4164321.1 4-hydroxy-tetrahydrodipicolinate synthase [Lachnospiraceae bacterium]
MAVFKGAGVAIVTPMNADQSVNYDKLEEIIEEQIAGGTDAIVIVGTTGEGSTLSMEEHSECIKKAVEFTKHRIPVVAGTGSNCTETAIQLTQEAEEHGADAALVVTPYYNKATQKGLVKHYSAIADSTKLPLILYNVPGRTGTNIAPETVATLHKTKKNIVGVKDATANLAQTSEMMRLCDGDLELYSGEDGLVVPILSLGGIGVISVVSNIAPHDVHEMVMSFLNGDIEKSRKMQLRELPLVDALFCEVNPIPVKTAMNLMGKEVGPLRLPLCDMEPANLERLKKAMKDYGLL